MSNALSQYLHHFNLLPAETIPIIINQFKPLQLKKDEFFLKEGQVCKTIGFVETGLLVYYTQPDNGPEMVSDFAEENDWVSQYQSFIGKTPSTLFIKALEPSLIQTITPDGLNYLYEQVPAFERLSKQLVEKAFMTMINKSLAFQHLKAEDRYEKMLADYPSVVQRVPQYYIASSSALRRRPLAGYGKINLPDFFS